MSTIIRFQIGLTSLLLLSACSSSPQHDVVIRNGIVYDGSGTAPYRGDLAISGDKITSIEPVIEGRGQLEINANGLAVSPGFINMLSWATESLLEDGRSQGNIRQGVTLEIFGEGTSMGPLNQAMKQDMLNRQGDITYDISWTTLSEYLEHLVQRGISPNVASFIGATTVRIHVMGYEDRPPTSQESEQMESLVRDAMEEGALGIGSALIYAPAFYASTEELITLAKVVAQYNGTYISHIRNESNQLLESVDELIAIVRESGIHGEIFHLKAAGQNNWKKLDTVIEAMELARAEGLDISSNMYTYTAGATGLDAAMPPWVQEGGHQAWVDRLKTPAIRNRVIQEMSTPTDEWENLYLAAGSAENVLLVGFKNDILKPLTGKSLAEVAKQRGKSPEETAIDLVIEDGSEVSTVYFFMSEENVRKKIRLPWMTFGSDASSQAPKGVFLKSNPHPRAYGNFARLLGKYVREEKIIPLEEAIYRLTSLPASHLKLKHRGSLTPGFFADLVIFDPKTIQDHATFENPHQYSTGVLHVFVNGQQVLSEGEHTGATPGQVVRGPGWREAQ
ncbi:MAG: D-aminoacylase [Acidobacteriota bacterium]|nr:D-aminoacylase [Acidobacteriota bacterium]